MEINLPNIKINVETANESFTSTYMLVISLATGNLNHQVSKFKHNIPHKYKWEFSCNQPSLQRIRSRWNVVSLQISFAQETLLLIMRSPILDKTLSPHTIKKSTEQDIHTIKPFNPSAQTQR